MPTSSSPSLFFKPLKHAAIVTFIVVTASIESFSTFDRYVLLGLVVCFLITAVRFIEREYVRETNQTAIVRNIADTIMDTVWVPVLVIVAGYAFFGRFQLWLWAAAVAGAGATIFYHGLTWKSTVTE